MADFRNLAIEAILADGKIDDKEVKVLKKELYANNKIDRKELEFLVTLRATAQKRKVRGVDGAFAKFFFDAVYDGVIGNGIISAGEATWLRKAIFADGKADAEEKALLRKLKRNARKTDGRFDRLVDEVCG